MSDGHSTGGIEDLTVALDIDGYDVEVEIGASTIQRQIRRLEEISTEEVSKNGFLNFDLSKFVKVKISPTHEKWEELADRSLNTDTDHPD
jgi:hypothetical protein